MSAFVVPLVGLLLWLTHVAQSFSARGAGWSRWAWGLGLPVVSAACFLSWSLFIPRARPANMFVSQTDTVWLGNAAFGLATWLVLMLLEPLLIGAGHLARTRRSRPGSPDRTR